MLSIALAILGISLLAFPAVVRAIPGRYASLLPEPIQALRRGDHPITLPTPASAGGAPDLNLAPTATPQPLPTITPSPTAEPLATLPPTETEGAAPSPTSEAPATLPPMEEAQPSPTPLPTQPPAFLLDGLRHERQGWNNCGPTTLAMALSYWGSDDGQFDIAPLLKPDPEDKHVGIHQMERYARDQGFETVIRVGGTLDGLKQLLCSGFPVIIESWYVRDARDQLGHYRLVVGYDDAAAVFTLYDSLYDPPTLMGYQELDELWRVFNRTYMVLATPDRWEELAVLLDMEGPPPSMVDPEVVGPELADPAMYERALATYYAELDQQPETCDAYASCSDWTAFTWFNIGTNLTALGRFEEGAAAYDHARQLGLHYRVLWYQFGPYESYYAAGRYDDVIALANATLATAKNLEESYYWRGMALLAQGDRAGARSNFESALRYHEAWAPALRALDEMEP
jgi:hypothetical protein